MRIENLRVTPIALGDPPLLNASGLHAPWALRTVLEIETDAGVTGLSEIPGDADVLAGLLRAASALRGTSVYDRRRCDEVLAAAFGADGQRGEQSWDGRRLIHAVSGLEVACLDAIARRLDCRVADLLGGPVRERVPFAGYLFFKYEGAGGGADLGPDGWNAARRAEALAADGIVAQAKAMVDAFGFASLKLKAGILDPDTEVDALLALRDAFGPGVPLRIDPNAAWSFDTALRQGERMRGVLEYYEDPVRGRDAMARLRSVLPIPLATNMCTVGFEDLPASFEAGSEDILLADHHYWGGLRACMELARICATFGRSLSMHSNTHAGISLAAMTQLGAALPELRYALDTHYPWQQDEIIRGGRLPIVDGAVTLPDAPGLGVEVDRSALERAHRNYLACGLTRRDDAAEMRRRDPDWRFLETRY